MRSALLLLALVNASVLAQTPIRPAIGSISFPGIASPVVYGMGRPVQSGTPYPARSGDNGATWVPLYVFPAGTQQNITGIAVDPSNPQVVYVSAQLNRGGVWKSTDGGQTWTQRSTGLPEGSAAVENLTVAANNPQVLYVKVNNLLFKSTDGAATWTQHGTLPQTLNGHRLALLPATPTTGYFMARSGGAFRSGDDGRTWNFRGQIDVQGGFVEQNAGALCLTIDPQQPDIVYSCIGILDAGQGLTGIWGFWRSADGGSTWKNVFETPQANAANEVLVGGTNVHFRVGFFGTSYVRSVNRGETFTNMGSLMSPMAVDPRNTNLVWGNSANVLSRDGGATVENLNAIFRPTFSRPAEPVAFQLEEGQSATNTLPVTTAENSGVVSFTAAVSDAPWLTIPAQTPTTTTGLRVNLSTAGLAPGTYSATVRLSSTQTNASSEIPIQLVVTPLVTGASYGLTIVAGGGSSTADNIAALTAQLSLVGSITTDAQGRIYFRDAQRLRMVDAGILRTIAGTGAFTAPGANSPNGDGGPALEATFSASPEGIAVDPQGRVFISDTGANRLRVIEPDRTIRSIFNSTTPVPNSTSRFVGPRGLAFASNGDLYLATLNGILRKPAGEDRLEMVFSRNASLSPSPFFEDVAVAADGTLYFSDSGRHQVQRLRPGTAAVVIAGTGTAGFNGDGMGTQVQLNRPSGLAVDAQGNLFIADTSNNRIRMVQPDGIVRTVAGGGERFNQSNIGATDASTFSPADVTIDPQGNPLFTSLGRVYRLTKDPSPRPRVLSGSFVNAGSNVAKLSPGALFSFYGRNLAASTEVASGSPWPTTLGGATVRMAGTPVPLFYASPTQINGQVPYNLNIGSTVFATVTVNGLISGDVRVTVSPSSPGILVFGENRAVAVNQNGSINTATTPAKPREIMVAYFTGTGLLDNPVATGVAAPADPLSKPVLPVRIFAGEFECRVFFAGLSPGFIGLGQANFEIPDLPPGDYSLTIRIGDEVSNGPVVTVGP